MKIRRLVFILTFFTLLWGLIPVSFAGDFVFKEDDFTAYSGIKAPSAEEYLKTEQAKMVRSFAAPNDNLFKLLPPSIDLSSALPYAGFQGKQESCVGWVLAFAIKSFQENREFGWGLDNSHLFSPSFVYNQVNEGKDEGAELQKGLQFVVDEGSVPLSIMPYKENDFLSQPNDDIKKIGLGFRALGYRRVDETNVNVIKSYLSSGEPLAIVMEVFSNFLKKRMSENQGVYGKREGQFLGYHSVVVVGYDDKKHAFKILNSWGKEWGVNGYGWISYDLFSTVVKQAFVLYDTPTAPQFASLLQNPKKINPQLVQGTPVIPRQPQSMPAGRQADAVLDRALLIVPDEAGIIYKGKWLRISDSMEEATHFLKNMGIVSGEIRVEKDYLGTGKIRKIEFYQSPTVSVATNQGASFGMGRDDVRRIYGTPDFIENTQNDETYFYHAMTEDWGGIPITRNMSLGFHYTPDGKVSYIVLENIFKDIKTGKDTAVPLTSDEKKEDDEGVHIASYDGKFQFTIPSSFSDIKKYIWGEGSYGYFFKNPSNPFEFLIFRVFNAGQAIDADFLKKRIQADLAAASAKPSLLGEEKRGGLTWEVYSENSMLRYYSFQNSSFYQIMLSPAAAENNKNSWAAKFWSSFSVRH